jgi:hypothetical protein
MDEVKELLFRIGSNHEELEVLVDGELVIKGSSQEAVEELIGLCDELQQAVKERGRVLTLAELDKLDI